MRLILARHGNTFAKGDKVFWVGATNDLPLVAEGCAQAERVADVLSNLSPLSAAYYAPLSRTRNFAEIAVERLSPPPPLCMDERLLELDYGSWSGRSDEEIRAFCDPAKLSAWNEQSVWPEGCGWAKSEQIVEAEIRDWVESLRSKYPDESSIFAVTSNGRLRYFLKLAEGEFAKRVQERTFKVATGKVCLLNINLQGEVTVQLWNAEPNSLLNPPVVS